MTRIQYNKLIRDRIPEIIQQDGRQCGVETMSDSDYVQALRDKLIEEAQEAAEASGDDLVKELADLYEVIDALMMASNIDRNQVLDRQAQRRRDRGGFKKQLRLLWTE